MIHLKKLTALLAISLSTGLASASVVDFGSSPYNRVTSFADGTFSQDLSGHYPDGFYTVSNTSAYNGYGQDGEYVLFNNPVQFNSASFTQFSIPADTVIVSLYDLASALLGQQTVTLTSAPQTLTFDANNVSKAVFNTTGGYDAYGDGRRSAWYLVDNITYSANQAEVPEPTTVALLGLGLLGVAASRRKSAKSKNA